MNFTEKKITENPFRVTEGIMLIKLSPKKRLSSFFILIKSPKNKAHETDISSDLYDFIASDSISCQSPTENYIGITNTLWCYSKYEIGVRNNNVIIILMAI